MGGCRGDNLMDCRFDDALCLVVLGEHRMVLGD